MKRTHWSDQHSEKSWEIIVNPDVDVNTTTRNHRKTLRKTQKNNNLLKTKRIVNTKIKGRWGPGFYIKLARGAVRTPATRHATYQVHFKHERAKILSPDSLVTIRTIQQTQDATSVLCVQYIDTLVGMRLDKPSYWDSWKFVGRLWCYHHEIWLDE